MRRSNKSAWTGKRSARAGKVMRRHNGSVTYHKVGYGLRTKKRLKSRWTKSNS